MTHSPGRQLQTKTRGFTIVELLIVIVVIAILAAITIVAYNGMQTRANNTQTIDAVKQFVKAYHLYAIDNGDYPTNVGCLGTGYPNGGKCLDQAGAHCFNTGGAYEATGPNNALKPYMNNKLPSVSQQQIPCGGSRYIGAYAAYNTAAKYVTIIMMLRGDQDCPPMSPNISSASKVYAADATRCAYVISPAS